MKQKQKLSPWCKEARKAMIDKDLGVSDLAEIIGITNVYASKVLSCSVYPSDELAEKISSFLEIGMPNNQSCSV